MESDDKLELARELARNKDHARALSLCDDYISGNADKLDGYRARAFVFMHQGDTASGLRDLRKLAAMGSRQAHDYFNLGRHLLAIGEVDESIAASSHSIEISLAHKSDYYMDVCVLLRALAYTMRQDFDAAQADLDTLPEKAEAYVSGLGLVTKAQVQSRLQGR